MLLQGTFHQHCIVKLKTPLPKFFKFCKKNNCNFILCNFSVRTLGYFKKNIDLENIKKPPQKVAYLWQLGVFFSAAPTAQNSPELHFRLINSPIQSSVLKSVVAVILLITSYSFRTRLTSPTEWTHRIDCTTRPWPSNSWRP